MTQEDKKLLLKDLCARLSYGVLVMVHDDEINEPVELLSIKPKRDKPFEIDDGYGENSSTYRNFEDIKPYLRPMSSMTDEERQELNLIPSSTEDEEFIGSYPNGKDVDYLNSHHFDYRGLIEKGLALEAPEGMYEEI